MAAKQGGSQTVRPVGRSTDRQTDTAVNNAICKMQLKGLNSFQNQFSFLDSFFCLLYCLAFLLFAFTFGNCEEVTRGVLATEINNKTIVIMLIFLLLRYRLMKRT